MHLRVLLLNLNRNIWWKFCLESKLQGHIYFQTCLRHTVAHTGTLRPLKVTANRKTQHRTENDKLRDLFPRQHAMVPPEDELDALDDLANRISKYSSKWDARIAEQKQARELIGDLKFIRSKTIENKYFRKPPSPNLLTWSAKEQIRYLHQKDPEEWSAEKLSELFPVSESSIKKIIKSKVRIHREKDILQHDLNVQKNWVDLKVSLENEDAASADDVYQAFRNSQDDIVIENAAGIQDLPFPVKIGDKFNPRGSFSAIVKDCYDAKEQLLKKAREELRSKSEEFSAMLSEVSNVFEMKSQGKTARSRSLKPAAVENVQGRVSETHHSEQLIAERNMKMSHRVNQQGNIQENMNKYVSEKYKDSPLTEHSEEYENMRCDIPYKIPVQQGKRSSDTYLSGNCVYDKNGKFLYRIP